MSKSSQQIRFCKSRDDTRIAYAICGRGPPLLFAQHWMHHLDHDWDNAIWRPWLDLLTRKHTLIRFDWRGCGLSDRDGVSFTGEKFIEDFEAVVAAAALKRFAIVGISSCGLFSAGYAARHPDRVSRLFLSAPGARGRLGSDPTPEDVNALQARLKILQLGWEEDQFASREYLIAQHIIDGTHADKQAFLDILTASSSAANAMRLVSTFARADMRDVFPKIVCPTTILHSRFDPLLPFDDAREAPALIPGAQFIPLESRNHLLLDSEPAWRRMVEALDEFLRDPAQTPSAEAKALANDLTPREHQVLELVAQGLGNDAIAKHLGISEKTVRNQLSIVFSKLDATSRAQIIVKARDAGFGVTR
jgi:pimeloyl-ACP methyl ester carboxylesterase/DNA-binding CsgD family transcriptional regulator